MKILYFFLFLFLFNVDIANAQDDNFFNRFFDKIVFAFDSEKQSKVELDKAFVKLNQLNQHIILDRFDEIEANKEKYLESIKIIRNKIKLNYDPEIELENTLKFRKWTLEHELFISILKEKDLISNRELFILQDFDNEILLLEEVIDLKQKNVMIKIKAIENQDEFKVKNMLKYKKKVLGVEDIERDILNEKVVRKLKVIKNSDNDNVTVARILLKKVRDVEVEEGEEILEKVEELSF